LASGGPIPQPLAVADLAQRVDTLARRVGALSDPEMRVAYVRHELRKLSPAEVADLVMVVLSRTEARHPPHGELLLAISLAIDATELRALRRDAVSVATERGQRDVVRVLGTADADDEVGAEAYRVPDFGRGRPLTLGERKALARRNDRDLIARVLRDPHPDVIGILLGNPSLTEQDVVRLCARRPIPPDVLRSVFRNTRWIIRYAIQRTLVLNPHTPLDIAMQLAPLLTAQDARRVARSEELHADLRDACRGRRGRGVVIH